MRIYIPATTKQLSELVTTGQTMIEHSYSLNAVVRELFPESDEETLEYIAFTSASDNALDLLSDSQLVRIVLTAEVSEQQTQLINANRYRLSHPLKRQDIAAIHVDEVASSSVLEQARSQQDHSMLDNVDLLWHNPSELEFLVELLEQP